jgi:hypothetical protein
VSRPPFGVWPKARRDSPASLRERAYRDALRDLATPAMGHPPLIRVAVPDGDGAAADARHRDALAPLAG